MSCEALHAAPTTATRTSGSARIGSGGPADPSFLSRSADSSGMVSASARCAALVATASYSA